MKKYFTKWLPVEGEIKEGDKVLYTGGQLNFPPDVYDVLDNVKEDMSAASVGGYGIEYSYDTPKPNTLGGVTRSAYLKIGYNILKKDYKKVKLFLCLMNIQVDDIVHEMDVPVSSIEHDYVYFSPLLVRRELKDCFKIVGEISPNTKWLKEGDELDEEDVWIQPVYDKLPFEDLDEPIKLLRNDIFVKCPTCGTPH